MRCFCSGLVSCCGGDNSAGSLITFTSRVLTGGPLPVFHFIGNCMCRGRGRCSGTVRRCGVYVRRSPGCANTCHGLNVYCYRVTRSLDSTTSALSVGDGTCGTGGRRVGNCCGLTLPVCRRLHGVSSNSSPSIGDT